MEKLLLLLALSAPWVLTESSCPNSCRSCSGGQVNCAGLGLTAITDPMPDDTLVVDLSQNEIQTLQNLPDMPMVGSFRISMNKIETLTDGTFSKMPVLMSLDLSMNQISKIRKNAFEGVKELQSLSLNGNKLTAIRKIFAQTPNVQSLRLGNNELTSIDEDNFKENKMIRQLDLSNNKITKIHRKAFKNLKMLRYLILSNNPLGTLPDLTFTSNILSLADFTNCALTNVPGPMPSSLKDFRLGNNMIAEISVDDFENITSLSLLILNNNKIRNVEHRSFGDLKNLRELWLTDNNLVYIPRGLPQSLSKLHMERNQVVELETMLFKEKSKITMLSLESNKIHKVHPDALKETKDIETLILQGNQITKLETGTFKDLPKIKMIKLIDNPIKSIEKGAFENLDSLSELYMSYIEKSGDEPILADNILTSMPSLSTLDLMSSIPLTKEMLGLMAAGRFKMEKLQTVNLQYSDVTTLPQNIQRVLPNVQNVYLDGNILVCDSKLRWLKDWMQTSEVTFSQYEEIVCDKPNTVKGMPIKDVPDQDFVVIAEEKPSHANEAIPVETAPVETRNEAVNNNNQRKADNTNRQKYEKTEKPAKEVARPAKNNEPERRPNEPAPRRESGMSGTRVVIRAPKGSDGSTEEKKRKKAEARAAAKARRKAAREERKRKNAARKLQRNRRHKKGSKRNKRNKRRIRNSQRRHCQTDAEGNVKCQRRRRCRVNEENGNVECPKRDKKDRRRNKRNKEVKAEQN